MVSNGAAMMISSPVLFKVIENRFDNVELKGLMPFHRDELTNSM